MSWHRYVSKARVADYLMLGWLPLPSLDGHPRLYARVHCAWICPCKMVEPK